MKIKNKKELVDFISKLNVGDMIELIEIEGLRCGETFRAIDEISRDFNIQLIWNMSCGKYCGEVIPAPKKFINKSGQYKMEYSKKVEAFLNETN